MHPLRNVLYLDRLARDAGLHTRPSPPPRPNTHPPFATFDLSDERAFDTPLVPQAWDILLRRYPSADFSQTLVGIIQHGARLGYTGPLRDTGRPPPTNHSMSDDALSSIRSQVAAAVASGYTRTVPHADTTVTFSPIGAVTKRQGSYRLINDLSWPTGSGESVNEGIQFPLGTMRYETIESFFSEIAQLEDTSDLVTWKIDLKDAYRHVPVATRDTPLLGFTLDDTHYVDCALNFGGSSSAFLFNLFAEGLHWILASFGLPSVHHYLDDFFGTCHKADAPAVLRFVLAVCSFLGLSVSPSKCTYGECVTVLGFTVDLPSKTAWLPPDKLARLRKSIQTALLQRRLSLADGQSLAGLLSNAARVCRVGRAFSRSIFDWLSSFTDARRSSSKALPRELLGDLRWWKHALRNTTGACLLHAPAGRLPIWTDASGAGRLGGHIGPAAAPLDTFSIDASPDSVGHGILTLEALAVFEALSRWGPLHQNHVFDLTVDNMALAFGLTSGRVAHRPTQQVLRAIFSILLRHTLSITVSWIPSNENALADTLSRQIGPVSHVQGTLSELTPEPMPELHLPTGIPW